MIIANACDIDYHDFQVSWYDDITEILPMSSCSALPALETLPSSTDYYVPPNRVYNGRLLANCSISLAGPTIVACYLAELRLPTDESHCLGLSGGWVGGNTRTSLTVIASDDSPSLIMHILWASSSFKMSQAVPAGCCLQHNMRCLLEALINI